jgi:hypothetical protein
MRNRSKLVTTLLLVLAGSGCGAIKGLTGKVKGAPKPPEAITKNAPETPVTGAGGGEKLRDYDAEQAAEIKVQKAAKRKVPADQILVLEPKPGLEKVEAMSPAWCKGIPEEPNADGSLLRRMFDSQLSITSSTPTDKALSNLGNALCGNPNDEGWKKMTAYLVQYWVNTSGLTKKEAIAAIGARVKFDEWTQQGIDFCAKFKPTDDPEMPNEELEVGKGIGEQFGCDGRNSDFLWYADREDTVPELLRMTIVNDNFLEIKDGYAPNIVPYIVFGPDARRLDASRLEKEIAGEPFNEWGRTKAREAHGAARLRARGYRAAVDALIAKDPDMKELYLDAPERAWNEWVKLRGANKAAFDAASSIEVKLFAANRKASAGCAETLRPMFAKYFASKNPKTYDEAKAVAIDPVGYSILSRLMVCEAFAKNAGQAQVMRKLIEEAPRRRGPRTAIIATTISILNKLVEDRPKLPISPEALPRIYNTELVGLVQETAGGQPPPERKAVVKSVKTQGKTIRVEFETVTWKEPKLSCKRTNRIYRIHDNGFIEYEQDCVQIGFETMTHTEEPVEIHADSAAGVKVGRLLVFVPGQGTAGVVAVHEGTARKQTFNFLGFPL